MFPLSWKLCRLQKDPYINFNNNFKFKWIQTAININLKAMAISLMCFRFSFLIKESNPPDIAFYIKLHAHPRLEFFISIRKFGFYSRFMCGINYSHGTAPLYSTRVNANTLFFTSLITERNHFRPVFLDFRKIYT